MSIAGYYREWLRKSPNEPADRMEMALAAISAFEECERKRQAIAPVLDERCYKVRYTQRDGEQAGDANSPETSSGLGRI